MRERELGTGRKRERRLTPPRAVTLSIASFIAAASLHAAQDPVTLPNSARIDGEMVRKIVGVLLIKVRAAGRPEL